MSSHRIVIVSDNTGVNRQMTRALTRRKYGDFVSFSDGGAALAEIEKEPPSLIIADVNAPVMDGWQLCRLLKSEEYQALNAIPILLISTTYRDATAVQLAADVGAFALLQVPFEDRDFIDLVAGQLEPAAVERRVRDLFTPQRNILVVDDDEAMVKILVHTLTGAGYDVAIARDGKEGLTAINRHEPSLVLLDYKMPKMDGMTVLQRAKEHHPDVIFIMMTAHGGETLAVDLMRAGAYDYVRKPFNIADIPPLCKKALNVYNMRRIHRQFIEHIAAEEASEHRFKALFQSAGDGILLSDATTGRIIDANPRFCELFGIERAELLTMSIHDLHSAGAFSAAARENRKTLGGVTCRHRDGAEFYVDITSTVLAQEHRKVVQSIVRNITQRKRLEDALQENAEKLKIQNTRLRELDRLKTDFLNTVSHELRTPLTSIQWSLDSLTEFVADGGDDKVQTLVGILKDDTGRLAGLIRDLLSFSRIEAGQLRLDKGPTDIAAFLGSLVEETKAISAEEDGMSIDLEIEEGLPTVPADAEKLRQVMSNLIGNALKYSGHSPHIVVSAERRGTPCKAVEVSVRDNGIGIEADDHERVFDKFFRVARKEVTGQPGTGLGLAIVKSIVEAHGGTVWVESNPGSGSRFAFTLPTG